MPFSKNNSGRARATDRFSTSTTSVGLAQSFQRWALVLSSLIPSICMAPSPTSATTGRPGGANLAASA
ncbi:hypothetical protein G6F24_018099 [Rhizopus arrhizus]|nr:hypothetical protein G6F24_018099 [Rhizopus arrhizus]